MRNPHRAIDVMAREVFDRAYRAMTTADEALALHVCAELEQVRGHYDLTLKTAPLIVRRVWGRPIRTQRDNLCGVCREKLPAGSSALLLVAHLQCPANWSPYED